MLPLPRPDPYCEEENDDLQRLLHRRQLHAVPGGRRGRTNHGLRAFPDCSSADAVRNRVLRAVADRTDRVATGQGTATSDATSQMTGALPSASRNRLDRDTFEADGLARLSGFPRMRASFR